ncbi:MAG: hypothetical protein PHH84_06040 [Oscillospiraceae bacterium]|nr:hypothetical protein [Oscillospiraceae bacterium]MDD4414410.1 hypothetical protein [Oscillospiraceae bacterium]
MAALPLIWSVMGLLLLFIGAWLLLSAYFAVVGTITLIPSIISLKQSGSPVIITAAILQILSGIALAFSCVYAIVSAFNSTEYEQSESAVSTSDYSLLLTILIVSLIIACLLSLAGAVLSIIRSVKSRKKRIALKKLTVAICLTTVSSSLVFTLFSGFILIAVFSL